MQQTIHIRPLRDCIKRSFLTATWLGWKIESNWTDPFLFAVYSIVKPLAGAAIIVVMYSVVAGGDFNTPYFAYLYFGNAFYQYVSAVINGISWTVLDDREHYKTLKYFYIAPIKIPFYLLGRGIAQILTASFSVFVTLLAGILLLHVPFDFSNVNWLLFIVSFFIGLIALVYMGLILAGVVLMLARHSDVVGEAVASAMFLFTGAVFPLSLLPSILRPIGYILPITYWLELLRRALIGESITDFSSLNQISNLELLGILTIFTIVLGAAGIRIFKACENRARERGLIDRITNY